MGAIDRTTETEALDMARDFAELIANATAYVQAKGEGRFLRRKAVLDSVAELRAGLAAVVDSLEPQAAQAALQHMQDVVDALFEPLPPYTAEVVQFNVNRSPDRDPQPPRAA